MPEIRYSRVIRADIERVFDLATSYEDFERILPEYFPSVRVKSRRGNIAVLEEHVRVSGRELVMMTRHVAERPHLHEVFVIGGDARGSHITEKYETVPSGTKITVNARIKLSGMMGIAGFFGRKKLERDFAKITDEFARIAES